MTRQSRRARTALGDRSRRLAAVALVIATCAPALTSSSSAQGAPPTADAADATAMDADRDAIEDEQAGDEDGFDWDALDEAGGDDGSGDDAMDELGGDGGFDWDALDEGDQDEVDWNSVWDDLDESEAGEEVEIPTGTDADVTGVRGVVIDDEIGEPIAGAEVAVDGIAEPERTSPTGAFYVPLPDGIYTLRVRRFSFGEAVYQAVVEAGTITDLGQVRLRPADDTVTVVVEGRAVEGSTATQNVARQESATVQDAIGAEQIARTTDSAASAAARRVVGVSILEDRFLVVRGLGGRYTAVTLNGVPVPRTDPDYPGVEIDIFPTDLLSSITLTKLPTPGSTGAFVGGLMDVQTRAFPESRELRLSVSVGANSNTTFRSVDVSPDGTALDALALGGGSRGLPDALPDDRRLDISPRGVSSEEYNQVVDAFSNEWTTDTRRAAPNLGLKLNYGDARDLASGHRLGFLVAGTYDAGPRIETGTASRTQLVDGEIEIVETLERERHDARSAWGVLGNVAYDLRNGHDLRLVSLTNQSAVDRVEVASGRNDESDALLDRQMVQYYARTLVFEQLLGRHRRLLPESSPWHETRVDWSTSVAFARRAEPDTRDFATLDGAWDDNPGTGDHFASGLRQLDLSASAALTLPYEDVLSLEAGAEVLATARSFETRRFHYQVVAGPTGLPFSDRSLPPEDLFSDAHVGSVGAGSALTLVDMARGGDAYDSDQLGIGGFVGSAWSVSEALELNAGARVEHFRQTIEDTSIGATGDPATRTDTDPLPSASAVLQAGEQVFLRAVYGASVARPQTREVAPFVYQDYVRRRTVTGNARLNRTYVHNTDLRLEWFPSATEVLALTLFNKAFRSPIESTLDQAGAVTFVNADGASNFGVEGEAQVGLDLLAPALEGVEVGVNAAWVRSQVDLPCEDANGDEQCDLQFTELRRPMAGQAPWIVNAMAGYTAREGRWSVFAFYNVLGPAIVEAGINGQPDAIETPVHTVDATLSIRLTEAFKMKLGGRNLANRCSAVEQEGLRTATRCRGADVSLSVTWEPPAAE